MIEFDGMSRPEITKILSISTEKNINPIIYLNETKKGKENGEKF